MKQVQLGQTPRLLFPQGRGFESEGESVLTIGSFLEL